MTAPAEPPPAAPRRRRWRCLVSILGACVAAVAAGLTVLFGVLFRKKDDGGFLDADGRPLYWPKTALPLWLYPDPATCEAGWLPYLNAAAHEWNACAGRHLFRLGAGPAGVAGAGVRGSVIEVRSGLGRTHTRLRYATDGRLWAAPITLGPLPPEEPVRERIVHHELGHVLGLAHDDFWESVMFPRAIDAPWSITQADKDRIRAAYAAEEEA